MDSPSPPHLLVFPFMAKGHITPLLHIADLFRRRGAAVTLLTAPANRPFIASCLSHPAAISIVDIPFPTNIPGIPPGIESTDQLPDISLWLELVEATKLMQPHFEQILQSLHPRLTLMITDFFLGWTLDSANKFSVPRLANYPMGSLPLCVSRLVPQGRFNVEGEKIKLHDLPWIDLKKGDISAVFIDPEGTKGTKYHDLTYEHSNSTMNSYGVVANTFYEMESEIVDLWNSKIGPPLWCLGPAGAPTAREPSQANRRTPWWISWLDQMAAEGKPVLYAAFGTQVEISAAQFREVQAGLEESGENFLWVVRKNGSDLELGFEERVRGRGIVVKEWVDQREVLDHGTVQGFLSHCGWSSLMESVCAKVPVAAWPMMWEQPLNAAAAEMAGVAVRIEERDGFVTREALARAVKDLMEGDAGEKVRKKVEEVGGAAVRAVEEGGSSWNAVGRLLSQLA
ncbi:UDP-glycosyltransferase 90A1-like [Andrographis paniculata]|uniref:UDP-glycosyltransferase 90A1-like n=1 Tax=Andrographis paniculata TaxID=175694 RepID=UPI0021E7E0C8|nr:UDP-glycosyltransferase 90A1-like [Andrographis paniculata]